MRRPLQTHHRNNYQLNLVYLIKRIRSLNIQVGAVPRATVRAGTQHISHSGAKLPVAAAGGHFLPAAPAGERCRTSLGSPAGPGTGWRGLIYRFVWRRASPAVRLRAGGAAGSF